MRTDATNRNCCKKHIITTLQGDYSTKQRRITIE
nr:MAG TPA: hypothetical protein [Caudoviricetes sp.]